ncbi:MAG: VOC family protein [Deltaproteobacteria bacterium]|nr:MAG: VOC family protein [Deltaproteobacteria bacterium]
MTRPITPCIWLDDQAEAAAELYLAAFRDARVTAVSRYPGDNPSQKPAGSVLTVEVELAGQPFTLLNGGPMWSPNSSISFFAHVDTPAEADALFAALEVGGVVMMPLDRYPWSERYGWVQDRFGVSWQVITGRREAGGSAVSVVPCLMFAGAARGRAEEALRTYQALFPGAGIDAIERYAAGEGPEGAVKHGRLALGGGRALLAMDSHVDHDVRFGAGVSLQLMCADQAEIDHFWDGLGAGGGQPGPCGWLEDRFGVSWQVVPERLGELLTSGDAAARDRAFRAMLGMGKLDIAALEAARDGR